MRLLKPGWVSHGGKPIFSIDIHPDGSRFATGGQGDNCGKVVIWNLEPVRSEEVEKNDSIPKMLCTLDNHLACVNCVRWSNNGHYLASAGDDKLIMIWQASRGGPTQVFGSNVVNVESWRCVSTIRGHSGDVLDVAWSPHDAWLASCSIDNTIIIWNAQKFPEQISVLKGHSGLVKGVTWDPVGKYLASQSDDKSLRVWRTLDWQQEACVTEPFQECGGTTHVLRLGWAPDGHYIVSAHAMNNSGPTAQIIERDGWKTAMDFVGHRKAVTVVRFNPKLLSKKMKKNQEKPQVYSCCAIGSRDRSLSVWMTALKRPLVVTHDLFSSSVLDISWGSTGMELLCCSWDGTVAYLNFSKEELGNPLSNDEKIKLQEKTYGKSLAASNALNNQIVESPAMLKLQQEQKKEAEKKTIDPVPGMPSNASNGAKTLITNGGKTNKQIETKTKDGRRRITPIFLAPQIPIGPDLDDCRDVSMVSFNSNSSNQPIFSSSKEPSSIIVEKLDQLGSPAATTFQGAKENMTSTAINGTASNLETSPIQAISTYEAKSSEKNKGLSSPVSIEKSSLKRRMEETTPDIPVVKKRGRPKKNPELPRHGATPTVVSSPVSNRQVVEKEPTKVVYSSDGLNLPAARMDKAVCLQISGQLGSDQARTLDIERSINIGSTFLHRIRCQLGGQNSWDMIFTSPVIAAAGNGQIVVACCEDKSIHLCSTNTGRRLIPSMTLDSKVSVLKCCSSLVMVITCKGFLFVWDTKGMQAKIRSQSLVGILHNSDMKIDRSLLTEQGVPIITVNNGNTYTFNSSMAAWTLLASKSDMLQQCSDHVSVLPAGVSANQNGILSALQPLKSSRGGSQASQLFRSNHELMQPSTITFLENQLVCCEELKSTKEYHFWIITYIRYLVQEGHELKIRDVCDSLLQPVFKSKSQAWNPKILDLNKSDLLSEILLIIGSNLQLQRIYTEYKDQADAIKV